MVPVDDRKAYAAGFPRWGKRVERPGNFTPKAGKGKTGQCQPSSKPHHALGLNLYAGRTGSSNLSSSPEKKRMIQRVESRLWLRGHLSIADTPGDAGRTASFAMGVGV